MRALRDVLIRPRSGDRQTETAGRTDQAPVTLRTHSTAALLALSLALGVVLSFANVIPAHSQAIPLLVRQVARVPVDPLDPAWNGVTPLNVPLSAQHITFPGGGAIFSVQVRSVHDDSRIAFQLSWQDATRNTSALSTQQFRDAAAIQLPLKPSVLPFYCMGQRGDGVNIWHWKANWQEDLVALPSGQQAAIGSNLQTYPQGQEPVFATGRSAGNPLAQAEHASPIENLTAGGFSTLTSLAEQDVQGKGVWQDGRWTVAFVRDLATKGGNDAQIPLGGASSVAFAVWDGANNDRGGQKATSTWFTLQMEGAARGGPVSPTAGLVAFIVVSVIITGGVWRALPGRRP